MLLTLVTPEKRVFQDVEVEEVIVPAYRGELNILPGHAPLVTTLSVGILRWREKGSSTFESAAISWGYCEVSSTGVSVLAETAETKEEVDKERALNTLKKTEKILQDPNLAVNEIEKFQRKMQKAQARLALLEGGSQTTH